MARASGSGVNNPNASEQQVYDYAILFDEHSTSTTSQLITVGINFVRVAAFNLAPGETITIQQITGEGPGNVTSNYAPVSGQVQLYYNAPDDQRTSYVLERPGRYRFVLAGGGLGTVRAFAFSYYSENEASQDLADALFAVLAQFKKLPIAGPGISIVVSGSTYTISNTGIITLTETSTINPQVSGTNASPIVRISAAMGNNISVNSDGIYSTGSGGSGLLTASPTATVTPNVVGSNLQENVNLSAGAGNLLQIRTDGLYYGINPPPNFANQYVSSSTGNDSNAGTIGSPLKTIQKAISNLPDGTMGNIYLLAGDTFHTYPTATSDVINTLTFGQSLNQAISIGNRSISIQPYNDAAINAINAYNTTNDTAYIPYVASQINYPIIKVTLSLATDNAVYVGISFNIGLLGSLTFQGINYVVGQTGTSSPTYLWGSIVGSGNILFLGCPILVGSIPLIGFRNNTGSQVVAFYHDHIADHGTPSTPPYFCDIGNQFFYNTIPVLAPGGLVVPSLTYTDIGDNVESYAATAALWPGIVIYSTAFRSFKKVITSIPIA